MRYCACQNFVKTKLIRFAEDLIFVLPSSIRERIQSILIQDEISEDFPTQLFCVEKEIENDEARSCHEKC